LADIGIGPAIVQYKQLTKNHLNSLFTLNTYIAFALSFALFFLSDAISSYYADETLAHVCQLMALVILFNALNVVPNAMMRRDKRFKTIAYRTIFFQILSGSIAVWGAFHGWGIYALLVTPILTAIGVFCVNYYNYPLRWVLHLDKDAVKMISSFSIFQFAFSFFNYFSRNLDKLIIGKFFSMTQLGYYDKSYHLMLMPVQNITFVIEPVLHPILSTLQDNKQELSNKNNKLAKIISNISFPIGLILYFGGGELIKMVYGNRWDAAIPVFQILAISLPLQMIQSTSGAIYQAAGKTNHMFYNGIINTVITVLGFITAAIFCGSIEAMAWAWVITLAINFIDSYFILNRYSLKSNVFAFYHAIIPQFVNSLVVFGLMSFLTYYIVDVNIMVSFVIKALACFVFTIVMAIILQQYSIKDIVIILTKK
jgi:PST family polysaccharide transporter